MEDNTKKLDIECLEFAIEVFNKLKNDNDEEQNKNNPYLILTSRIGILFDNFKSFIYSDNFFQNPELKFKLLKIAFEYYIAHLNDSARYSWRIYEIKNCCEFIISILFPETVVNKPLDELELSARTQNCLFSTFERNATIKDIIEYSPAELLKIPNFGRRSLEELDKMLSSYGFRLSWNSTKKLVYINGNLKAEK